MIAFKVVTPKGEYLKQEVKSIHVKTVVGETTILPNHMPIFASLVPCKLVLKNENDEEEIFAISGGFLQFNKNEGRKRHFRADPDSRLRVPVPVRRSCGIRHHSDDRQLRTGACPRKRGSTPEPESKSTPSGRYRHDADRLPGDGARCG